MCLLSGFWDILTWRMRKTLAKDGHSKFSSKWTTSVGFVYLTTNRLKRVKHSCVKFQTKRHLPHLPTPKELCAARCAPQTLFLQSFRSLWARRIDNVACKMRFPLVSMNNTPLSINGLQKNPRLQAYSWWIRRTLSDPASLHSTLTFWCSVSNILGPAACHSPPS